MLLRNLLAVVLAACVVAGASTSSALAATAGQSYAWRGDGTDVGVGGTGTVDQVFSSVAVSNDDGRVFIGRQFDPNAVGGFEVLNPNGASLTQVDTSNWTSAIAVSPDGAAVYTLNAFGSPVKYVSDGLPTPTYSPAPAWAPNILGGPTGIAVDPSTGDVLIAAGGPVQRFDSSTGAPLPAIDGSTITDGAGPLAAVRVAVAPNRDVYALHANGRVEHMGANGSWKGRLAIPPTSGVYTTPGLAVNPQNGDVAVELSPGFVTPNDTVIQIYSSSNVLKDSIRVPSAVASGGKGLAFSADGTKLYIGLPNGTAHVFVLGTRPGLDGPTASQLTPTSFHLTGHVASNGEMTTARFEYCLASDPCSNYLTTDAPSPWRRLPNHAGLTAANDPIADDLAGLEPETDYLVRAVAVNDASKVENITAPLTVRTPSGPPVVETGAATADDRSAQLNGTIDTLRSQTTYHFEYGLSTNYGSRAPAGVEAVAGNLRERPFRQSVKGLQPGTIYHYRLVATNRVGTTAGADRTFRTLGVDEVAPRRGYEQVTPANKKGLALISNWGFQAGPGGGAIEYAVSAPGLDAPSAVQIGRYFARRTDAGWDQQSLDPKVDLTTVILSSVTHAVSDDFEHAMVVTSVALTPDAVQGAANIYMSDVRTGTYQLVGTATQPNAVSGMDGTKQQNVFIGGAPDFSWVVLISRFPLLPNAPQVAMYKWSRASGLSLISRLPNGNAIPTGNTWFTSSELTANRLVSDDGEAAAFSLDGADAGVYRRSGGQTVAISESQATGGPSGPQPGTAVGMSRDGRYVVLLSAVKLTDDAEDLTGSQVEKNLYRYDASSGQLTYLARQGGSGGDGSIDVPAISDDGNTIYYNGQAETTDSNGLPVLANGLATWRNGQRHLIATSPSRDGLAYTSPNGRYLAFNQGGSVHLYDATAGQENCISCTASGQGGSGQLPEGERNISNRRPQTVTDDGRAYFGTRLSLVGSDRNNAADVYEYHNGRTTLISPGDLDYNAILVDISPDGRDVFFTTAEGLVGQDKDGAYDIYDARVGGGLASQNPPPPDAPCAKSECAEPGTGPVAGPSSGSLPQSSGTPGARTNQQKVKVSLTRVSVGSKSVRITFHASQRGRVKVSGARVVTTYRNVAKEGTYSMSVPLSKRARSLLRTHRKVKVSVKVSLAGGWGTASAKYSRTLGN
ncbi:MAG: hypothetical protein ABW167_12920 [Baekduia sp.]